MIWFCEMVHGEDIIVPTAIVGAAAAGIGATPVALAEIYRAHVFEKHFWDFIRKTTPEFAKGRAELSSPVTITS